MLVLLHEMLLKVPTLLIWSLKPCDLAVPNSLIQYNSLVLRNEVSRIGFSELWLTFQAHAIHRMICLIEVSVE